MLRNKTLPSIVALMMFSSSLLGCNSSSSVNEQLPVQDETVNSLSADSSSPVAFLLKNKTIKDTVINRLFSGLDKNKSGKVSKDEFLSVYKDKNSDKAKNASSLFDSYASDKVNGLTKTELEKLSLDKLNGNVSKNSSSSNLSKVTKSAVGNSIFNDFKDSSNSMSEKAFNNFAKKNKFDASTTKQLFSELDSNKSKTLDAQEFSVLVTAVDMSQSQQKNGLNGIIRLIVLSPIALPLYPFAIIAGAIFDMEPKDYLLGYWKNIYYGDFGD